MEGLRRSSRLKRNLVVPPPPDTEDVDDDLADEIVVPGPSRDLNTPPPSTEPDYNAFCPDDIISYESITPEDLVLRNGQIFQFCNGIIDGNVDFENIFVEVCTSCYLDYTEFDEEKARVQIAKIGDKVSKLVLRCIGWNSTMHGPVDNQFKLFGIFIAACKNVEQLSVTINDAVVMNPKSIDHLKLMVGDLGRRPRLKILQYGLNGPYGPANFIPLVLSCPRVQCIHLGCNLTLSDCREMDAKFPNIFERVSSLSMYNYEIVKFIFPRELNRVTGLFICPPYKMKLWTRTLNQFADQLVHLSIQLGILYGNYRENPVPVTLPVMKNLKTLDFDYSQLDDASPIHAICNLWGPVGNTKIFPKLRQFWLRLNRSNYRAARRDRAGHLSMPKVVFGLLKLGPPGPRKPTSKFPNMRHFQLYIDGRDIILVSKRQDLERLLAQMKPYFPNLEFPALKSLPVAEEEDEEEN